MSWPTWTTTAPPIPTAAVAATPMQSTLMPPTVNSAPSVLPPGLQYSPEQWAQAQQQNWQQWAQWQQQYQQWHQQYGAEYQKSITAMQSTVASTQPPLPNFANTSVAPPLPVEHKPPLPPEEPPQHQSVLSSYTSIPSNSGQIGYDTAPSAAVPPQTNQRQMSWQQKSDYSQVKKPVFDQWGTQKDTAVIQTAFTQPPPQPASNKANVEELSEAEKKFDKEFAAWEAQFQKWKEQNVNHPDKTQYREYEKKWESWRNSLLERREQMRKKRLALTGGTAVLVPSKVPNFSQPPPVIPKQTVSPTTQQPLIPQAPPPTTGQYTTPPPNQIDDGFSLKNQSDQIKPAGGFLGTATSVSGIPGLDLVKDDGKDHDIENKNKEPDLEAISKGINTILGDQKLLSMLSMVTKHPPPAPVQPKADFSSQSAGNYQENQFGNMSLPPPSLPYRGDHCNDQSNQSFEDRSNLGDYHQREAVTNFDDQTRSSFTMGQNDPEQNVRIKGQSSRFGDDRLSTNLVPNVSKNNVQERTAPKSLLSLTFPPGGPKMSSDEIGGSMGESNVSDNFGSGASKKNFGRLANETFKQRTQDGFNRFGQNKFPEDSFSQENRMNNFNRNDRFASDNYGKFETNHFQSENDRYDNMKEDRFRNYGGRGDQNYSRSYNQDDDFDTYNEDDDYDKYHNIFNEDDVNYKDENQYNYNNSRRYLGNDFQNEYDSQAPISAKQNVPPKEVLMQESAVTVAPQTQEPAPEEPIFEPAKVIDYEHKSLRKPEIEVAVEPVNMFDYRHKPLNRIQLSDRPKWLSDCVRFIREFDPSASRMYERSPAERTERYPSGNRNRSFEHDRDKKDYKGRGSYGKDGRNFDRDNREYESEHKDSRHDKSSYRNERDEKYEDYSPQDRKRLKLEDSKRDSKSSDRNDLQKSEEKINLKDSLEELSDEDMDWEAGERNKLHNKSFEEIHNSRSNSPILSNPPNPSSTVSEIHMIEDIINQPGRFNRPPRIVIILRGPPGSGKTHLARLIKDKEVENGGSAPRILSLDDYFMVEHEKIVVEDGKSVTIKEMVYEYESEMEESYRSSFVKSFKKTITDGYFPFIIVDNVNDKVKYFGEMWSFAKQNGFQVYICQLDLDPVLCTKRNIHNRSEAEIEECIAGWEPTPSHHPTIDATSFLQSNQIKEVDMEMEEEKIPEEHPSNEPAEPNLMESTNRSEKTEPWKNTFKWRGTGNYRGNQNRGRRGSGGQTWRSRGNWRR